MALVPNLLAPSYRYPAPRPFGGPVWFNPYAGMRGSWHKASLHAHGLTCCSPSRERRTDAEMARYYRTLGYDIALVSDHQRIADGDALSDYEHGMNARKTHQLVIGARRVDWLDFPLYQSSDDKQYVLDRLHAEAPVVVLAHPEIRDGYTFQDLTRLTGYDGMEVLHDGDSFERWWDAALSAGRLSFATGSDDAHDTAHADRMGVSWTMIRAPSARAADLLVALQHGWTYAVNGERGRNGIELRDVRIRGDTLLVTLDRIADRIVFVGQAGHVRSITAASDHAAYVLRPEDTYIRTAVEGRGTALYLNPVVRTAGGAVARLTAVATPLGAWPRASAIAATLVGVGWGLRRRGRPAVSDRRRRVAPEPLPTPEA